MKPDNTDELIRQNAGLVYHALKVCNCAYSEEAKSIAFEALWRAIKTYDHSKGAKFSTYAFTCIRNAIYDFFRELKEIQSMEVPLDNFYNLGTLDVVFNDDFSTDYSALHKAVDDALNKLSGKKKMIAKYWLESEMSATAIATEVSCSQSYASQCIAEFKSILKKELINAGYGRDASCS